MVVLILKGELPKPDLIAFADTGGEWPETYDFTARYIRPALDQAGIRFEQVSAATPLVPSLYDMLWRQWQIPEVVRRWCTDKWKIRPLKRLFKAAEITEEWIGFSLDEQGRAARSMENRRGKPWGVCFPLIDERISAADCEWLIGKFGWPVPLKSACIFCAFQHPWRARLLFERHPDLFEKVAKLEDRWLERRGNVEWRIIGNTPWREFAHIQLNLFGGDWNYGCQDGYCFR